MIEYNGEQYMTGAEVARKFSHISHATCYNNLLRHMQKCYLPGRKNALYRQAEVEQFAEVRMNAEHNRSVSPASTTTEETGNAVTSSPDSQTCVSGWQSQYRPSSPQTQASDCWAISAAEATLTTQKGPAAP